MSLLFFSGFDPPKIVCAGALGMESGEIPSSALKSSSDYNQYFGAVRSRLNENQDGSYYGGWASKHADVGQWLQIDLGKITKVTRIATRGRYDANWWVTKYKLSYSDGGKFQFYKNGEVSSIFLQLLSNWLRIEDVSPFRISESLVDKHLGLGSYWGWG